MKLRWNQALSWRMRRHLLDPVGDASVPDVVRRLAAIPAQSMPNAELAVRARRQRSRAGEVTRALSSGRVIKTFAFRGATHLMAVEEAGHYLALRAASRMWELPSWQEFYRLKPDDWPRLRQAVRDALADGPLTRAELGAAVTSQRRFGHLGFAFADDAGTMLKPLAWQGDMCFGPSRDGRTTFALLDANPRWKGLPDLDDAGRHAIAAYVGSYGPTTAEHLHYWLGSGLSAGRKRIRTWLADLGDRFADVEIEGESAFVRRDDLDELAEATPSTAVRFLPAYDQWVLGAGTADPHVVPPAHREPISRGANLVLSGGVVAGTWTTRDDVLSIAWFADTAGRAPKKALEAEAARLSTLLGRELDTAVASA